jgi:hypothetical protein
MIFFRQGTLQLTGFFRLHEKNMRFREHRPNVPDLSGIAPHLPELQTSRELFMALRHFMRIIYDTRINVRDPRPRTSLRPGGAGMLNIYSL